MITRHTTIGDERGKLIALESGVHIPFAVKRVFYIYGVNPSLRRGQHSHFKTKQYLIAVNGSCQVTLDNGKQRENYLLDKPNIGLFQDAMIWGTMHTFSKDCVLLVLANENYDGADYIRNYDDYLRMKNL